MEEKEKKGWGGARAGAGRKPTNHGKYVGFYPTQEVERVLKQMEGSRTDILNEAVMLLAKEKGII